ncbi:MAG: hypothetical protein PHY25_05165 [Dehalococcoidales bacterium]|nr:hypothetical protein [Dehalococcoidales bacterium]MDX9804023.1 hypothetical protein [Dehalococcoidales bacterium]
MYKEERRFSISGNNKGLVCPFRLLLCQEGYCSGCQIYLDWLQEEGHSTINPWETGESPGKSGYSEP